MMQLEIHKRTDEFFKGDVSYASLSLAKELIEHNYDSRNYFYFVANERWVDWIWENNLLDNIFKKVESSSESTYYRIPEIEFLNRMAGKVPDKVTKILLAVQFTKENSTPEIINNLFWIVGLLDVNYIKLLLPKMIEERWLSLVLPYSRTGYEFDKMVKKIMEDKSYDVLLNLTKFLLEIRSKGELDKIERFSLSDKLFCLSDISASGIFSAILEVHSDLKKEFLKCLLQVIGNIVKIRNWKETKVFEEDDPFYLFDVDIFNIDLHKGNRLGTRADIKDLIATVKLLIDKIYESKIDNPNEFIKIYKNEISNLPDSQTCWKLKLYATTRLPEAFEEDIKVFLFRLFDAGENHYEIDNGAEYHHGLIEGFKVLNFKDKRDYVKKVISFFGPVLEDERKYEIRKRDGLELLTFIKNYLIDSEKKEINQVFGNFLNPDTLKPHPSMGEVISGFVTHISPVKVSGFTIEKLVDYLQSEGSPEKLNEEFKHDSFLSPRGPEGVAEEIKSDFKLRYKDYIHKINLFFNPGRVDSGYTHSVLQAIEDYFRSGLKFEKNEILSIINFFDLIKIKAEIQPLIPLKSDALLADWVSVHRSVASVLLSILVEKNNLELFKENQSKIFGIIKYLLSYKYSPDPEDEWDKTNESSHVAVNSVRGEAYRSFVQYMYNQGNDSISEEVKSEFEFLLESEKSNAVRFTIGQFFASFYYRDEKYICKLLPKIFPLKNKKIFFPTWEGYLSSSMYKEVFIKLEKYYLFAVRLDPKKYPEKKYSRTLDELLATHLALGYAHFDFGIGSKLFDIFWDINVPARHEEFVSFLGRSYVNKDDHLNQSSENIDKIKQKLLDFWDWLNLKEGVTEKAYAGFGMWVNPNVTFFTDEVLIGKLNMSLIKSRGELEWDYGFTRRIEIFATVNPTGTLGLIKSYLLCDGELNLHRRMPLFSLDHEIKIALQVIYKNNNLRSDVILLIDKLIEKGGQIFWGLKTVIT